MDEAISPALTKYWEVRNMPNAVLEEVVEYALKEEYVSSRTRAHEALKGVLQFLSCVSQREHREVPLVMADDDIYMMYYALQMGHSYGGWWSFEKFCEAHFGVQHHFRRLDLTGLSSTAVADAGGIVYTVGQLESNFGCELEKTLSEWVVSYEKDDLKPAALIWAKQWPGEGAPIHAHQLTGVLNRWNQFVY